MSSNPVCSYCGSGNIKGYRYKCMLCENYDLCSRCFEMRMINREHLLNHPVVRFDEPGILFGFEVDHDLNLNDLKRKFKNESHTGFYCDMCNCDSIKGLRFKCDQCSNFDICLDCYESKQDKGDHKADTHSLIVIAKNISIQIDPDEIVIDTFQVSKLGQGAFGSVYKAKYKNETVACKKMLNKKDLVKSYLRELVAYTEIKGDNILKMIGYSIKRLDSVQSELIILTEYMAKGSLAKLMKDEPNMSYRRRLKIIVDVAAGLSRIHDRYFIHRDIRPDNILVDANYNAKIGDMGIAKMLKKEEMNVTIMHSVSGGCSYYLPREFYGRKYSTKLDIYTFGLTLNEIFGGCHQLVKNREITITKKAPVFIYFVEWCTRQVQKDRPSAKVIEKELNYFSRVINQYINVNSEKYSKCETPKDKNELFMEYYHRAFNHYCERLESSTKEENKGDDLDYEGDDDDDEVITPEKCHKAQN